jgi:RimJ/RimL family protein N-acetyltransferase
MRIMQLRLRPAAADPGAPQFEADARFVLRVRNDPETRMMSLDSEVISWETHLAWYSKAARNPEQHLYVIESDSAQIGTLRLEEDRRVPHAAEIHVAVLPDHRSKGLGREAIECAWQEAVRLGYEAIVARVKSANSQSLRVFEKAGFIRQREHPTADCGVVTLLRLSDEID